MATITEPGVYTISAEEYHADPCPKPSLSSSIGKIIEGETPWHAWDAHPRLNPNFEPKEEDKFDIGKAAHSLVLNDPAKFAILPYDDYKKDVAKQAKAKARADGKIPLLEKHWARVQTMADVARAQLDSVPEFEAIFQKGNGEPEQTLVWTEKYEGQTIWMRCRLDWKPNDLVRFPDYKSTESCNPDVWKNIIFNVGHDFQAAFYRRGIRALGLGRQPKMCFVVQETGSPHALCVIDLLPEALELADRKVDRAVRKWFWCSRENRWPGYPAKIVSVGVPPWMETQAMEREERNADLASRYGADPDLLALGFESQRPI